MNKGISAGFVLGVLLMFEFLFAQAPDTLWTKRYDNGSNDVGYSAEPTSDSGYILASSSWNGLDLDIWTIKTNKLGNAVWQMIWSGLSGGDDEPGCIRQTMDGGYVLTGYTTRTGLGNTDLVLIKYGSAGSMQWQRRYGVQGDWMIDFGSWVEQTSDSGFIITGMHSSPEGIWLIKTDQTGIIVWQRTLGEGVSGNCVRQTSDNGYIICGVGSAGDILLKVDSLGGVLWTQNYGGSDAQKVFETQQHGYAVLGNKSGDFWLMKTDSAGALIWEKAYGGSSAEDAYGLGLVNDGGYILTGRTFSFGAGESDMWTVRTDSLGDTLWTKLLGGIYDEWGMSAAQTLDNGFMLFGYTELGGTGSDDAWLIKLHPEMVGIREEADELTNRVALYSRPNPFKGKTKIHYFLPAGADVSINIYDVMGNRVANVACGYRCAGLHSEDWTYLVGHNKELSAGLYICELRTEKYRQAIKMLLIK